MDNKKVFKTVKKIVDANRYINIATATQSGDPWISPVFFAFDTNFNFFWYSPKNSSHSVLIRENPKVSAVIYNSTLVGDDIEAVYLTGHATELSKKDLNIKVITIYTKRLLHLKLLTLKEFRNWRNKIADFKGKSPLRFYRLKVEKLWVLAPSKFYKGHYIDSKNEINIS